MIRVLGAALAAIITLLGLTLALWFAPATQVNLPQQVELNIDASGIAHPITAVLLNFRSYDTLLEVAVVLVAVVAGLALRERGPRVTPHERSADPMLQALTRRLLPLLVLTGVYVLWAGSYAPGGAFQAGALVAAAGVLARLAGYDIASRVDRLLRLGLALGFILFLTVAVSAMFGGRPFLNYPDEWAGSLIFLIEAVLTFSIGLTLLSLFVHAPGDASPQGGGDYGR
ncbi:MnhB domain-containing protein [Aliidiomarina sanyensis]|uniref:Sodium:proton antiporter n=1 Tax=Aliidiomarina sanyensis TaxID=1249555 RepID=A0A432WGI3_9GAMM|nr:MnhB domain-containing protein [Aliidiomarina sanyensis]RUO32851.1 sodium:proton antiporter [Aliidiomarina sanyensis]